MGVCATDVPKLYGGGARNTGEPYRQGTDARSHPQGRKGPHRRGQDHLLRADDVLHRDTHRDGGYRRMQAQPDRRRRKGLQPGEPVQ